jgi:ABC-2 type transport system permease protein
LNGGLSNVLTIARKELKVYFVSPLFYVVTALFVLAYGFFFAVNTISSQQATLQATFNIVVFVMVLLAPLLTMRLVSLEKQQGTIELLLTNPVRDIELVAGKYLAALAMLATLLATTLISVVILLFTAVDKQQFLFLKIGQLDWGSLLVGYAGNILVLGGFMAVGLFASTLTQNQIIAAVISIIFLLVLLIIPSAASLFQPPFSDFLSYLSPRDHIDAFGAGTVALPDLAYGLTMIGVPLYLSVVALGARRWH